MRYLRIWLTVASYKIWDVCEVKDNLKNKLKCIIFNSSSWILSLSMKDVIDFN